MNIEEVLLGHGFKNVSLSYYKQDIGDRSLFAYWNLAFRKHYPQRNHRTLFKVEHVNFEFNRDDYRDFYIEKLFHLTSLEFIELINTLAPIHNFEELQTVLLSLPSDNRES